MKTAAWQRVWDEHARSDPMWAILTDPGKRGGKWNADEFFATGVAEIGYFIEKIGPWGVPVSRGRAMDFGCGIGRVTQPLADHFDRVVGVDISPEMLELARRHNRQGERCEYVWNDGPKLRQFQHDSFDLIYSKLVLQHIRPRRVRSFLNEFMRLLAPGGLLFFQYPSRPVHPASALVGRMDFWLRSMPFSPKCSLMYMNSMQQSRVVALLERNGGRIVGIEPNQDAGSEYVSLDYAATK